MEWLNVLTVAIGLAFWSVALVGLGLWLWSIRPGRPPPLISINMERVAADLHRRDMGRELAELERQGVPLWRPDPSKVETAREDR